MCLWKWERYSGCKHQGKRFNRFCSKAKATGTRCEKMNWPPRLYTSNEPAHCHLCYRSVVNQIREKHASDIAYFKEIIRKNMAIRSSKHKAKQHPTAATEINYALQALVKANEYGKKELADYWGATWSWMNLTVRPPGSPQPSDFDKKLEDLTNKFCAWFEATECVLGEYLTERGRHDRAIRWTSHGEGPPIITVVRVPLVAPIATNEDPGSHVQSQSATRTSYKCPPGAWTLSPPPRDRWERKRRRAIAQAEQDISSLPVRYREAID